MMWLFIGLAFAHCDHDGDGFGAVGTNCFMPTDCDDTDARAHPGADVCVDFNLDLDCDGLIGFDDPDVGTRVPFMIDADGDGLGISVLGGWPANCLPEGFVGVGLHDCNDGDPQVGLQQTGYIDVDGDGIGVAPWLTFCGPDAPELVSTRGDCTPFAPGSECVETLCSDGVDNDLDGAVDLSDTDCPTYQPRYSDVDGDGLGDGASPVPDGVLNAWDCNDSDPVSIPPAWMDRDGDGWGSDERIACPLANEGVTNSWDCDDSDPAVTLASTTFYATDGDGDGAGIHPYTDCDSSTALAIGLDCDDADPAVSPTISESCDLVDRDCDGSPDPGACPQEWDCFDGTDNDGDGLLDCEDADCMGYPGLCTEVVCDDQLDSDADGDTDCADSDCAGDWFCMRVRSTVLSGTWSHRSGPGNAHDTVMLVARGYAIPLGATWSTAAVETCEFQVNGRRSWGYDITTSSTMSAQGCSNGNFLPTFQMAQGRWWTEIETYSSYRGWPYHLSHKAGFVEPYLDQTHEPGQ